jgi:hypothetical protein
MLDALAELGWMNLALGVLIAVALMLLFWVPYLRKEIHDGKGELGPQRKLEGGRVAAGPVAPSGAGDNNPGRRGDPAPGEPSGQADPYGDRAQRDAPPVRT